MSSFWLGRGPKRPPVRQSANLFVRQEDTPSSYALTKHFAKLHRNGPIPADHSGTSDHRKDLPLESGQ